MTVKRIITRLEAVRLLDNDDLYEADEWAVDPERRGTVLNLHRRFAPTLSRRLRFASKAGPKPLCFVSDSELDNQATRGIRELLPESAALMDSILAVMDHLPISDKVVTVTDELLAELHSGEFQLPEELSTGSPLVEGASRAVVVNAYERNPEARRQCIAAYGPTCCICEFNFGAIYGPDTEGHIHVHHVRPLSEISGVYVVNPVEDLRPVCPNCHAVLHLGGRCRSIDEVRQMLVRQRNV